MSKTEQLAVNALWVLKNVIFQSDHETKRLLMRFFRADDFLKLTGAETPLRVKEQALNIVRNLACGNAMVLRS